MDGFGEDKPRIAICEDEFIVALDIKNFLQRNGYDVVGTFPAAEELLALAESLNLDLVLMDIHLQGAMDGLEAASILLERWTIPVILLTAYADSPTIERAKLTHPYAYILKPYDERELKTAIAIGLYRASMERRLKTSEERYRIIFEDGLVPALLVDHSGQVMESNRAFSRLAHGENSLDRIFSDDSELNELFLAMKENKVYGPREISVQQPDGKHAWALFIAAPLELAGTGTCYQCQALDTTERKELLDQLIHAQKLSALGRFAGGVAHDFNNVLTAIMGYSNLMRADLEDGISGLEELDGIDQAAKRAAGLARQLLLFSRRNEAEPVRFSLPGMALGMERMLNRLVGDSASLAVRAKESGQLIQADRTRIEQAVMNLVVNARDAMSDGGRITIITDSLETKTEIQGTLETIPAGLWCYIEVRDEGSGIDPKNLSRIFEPFFTTKPPDQGTGLGLSMVATVVRQAGGHVIVNSKKGAGTSFRLLFPQAGIASPASKTAANTNQLDSSGFARKYRDGLHVLLVEYDDSVQAIVEVILERAGCHVVPASHPGEALLRAEQLARKPDLLVTDYTMPLMGGPELARRLRTTIPGLPALHLRGTEGEGATTPASSNDYFMDKPFTELELLTMIEAILNDRPEKEPELLFDV
jgi:two-component system, cell cycle sensor histidine kinase and response regulator CckA